MPHEVASCCRECAIVSMRHVSAVSRKWRIERSFASMASISDCCSPILLMYTALLSFFLSPEITYMEISY